jgi:hypothetical protein
MHPANAINKHSNTTSIVQQTVLKNENNSQDHSNCLHNKDCVLESDRVQAYAT